MLFGARTGFGLEFHVERDPGLLCVDVFVGGLHVNRVGIGRDLIRTFTDDWIVSISDLTPQVR
ncbi:hypothetical protein P9869_27730 [Streptomyces ossamyceticus]|nr:hypothetical protein [Streptomyces ossamyceticus]